MDIGNGPLNSMVTPSGFKGMNIGNGPSGNDGYALGLLMEWTSQLTIATIQVGNERTIMPLGTMVMPLGFSWNGHG